MRKKLKNKISILILVLFLSLFAASFILLRQNTPLLAAVGSFIFAQSEREVEYPVIPGPEEGSKIAITKNTTLTEYIEYAFYFSLILGVIIVIGTLIYGGFLYLTSAGNTGKQRGAQDQIKASFLGLLILIFSFMVLKTVNPQLVKLELEEKPYLGKGIILQNSKGKKLQIGVSIANLAAAFPDFADWGNEDLTLVGEKEGEEWNKNLEEVRVIAYPNPDFELKKGGRPTDLKYWVPRNDFPRSFASIEVKPYPPGAYLWDLEEGLIANKLYLAQDIERFPSEWDDKAVVIEIKKGKKGDEGIEYMAVLYENPHFSGGLKIFKFGENVNEDNGPLSKKESIQGRDLWGNVEKVSSAQIFQVGPKENCNGVAFYTEPDRKGSGCILDAIQEIPVNIMEIPRCQNIYTDPGRELVDFEDNIRSIFIPLRWACLVVLFEHPTGDTNFPGKHSEVFTESDPNLGNNPIGKCNPHFYDYLWPGTKPCASAVAVFSRAIE